MTVEAFDSVAESYDRSFTETFLGRELRQIVWRKMAYAFRPGTRVWELNCGTGEDAVWLAGRGIRVLATDGSPAMLACAARKAASNRLSDMIEFLEFNFSAHASGPPGLEFDGALSNFGGLNCIRDLRPLARILGRSIKPGGRLIIVVMGRWCAWEVLWHMLRFEPRRAFRRFARDGAESRVGSRKVQVWYPSPRTVQSAFAPEFKLKSLTGLGVFLPPSYLQDVVARSNGLFRLLCRLEESLASTALLHRFGDHILFDFERTTLISRGSG